jgi:hypothetical protein
MDGIPARDPAAPEQDLDPMICAHDKAVSLNVNNSSKKYLHLEVGGRNPRKTTEVCQSSLTRCTFDEYVQPVKLTIMCELEYELFYNTINSD